MKIPLETFEAEKKIFQRCGTKSSSISFVDPKRPKQPPSLPRKVSGSNLERTKIVGGVPSKSIKNVSLDKLPLKSRNVIASKLPTYDASLLDKKVSSHIVTEDLMRKEHVASQFLSILMGKGKLTRHRATTPLLGRKVWGNAEKTKRLSHAQRLQLFQAVLKEPLPFLELHGRFGISKQTIKRLVKKGLLTEMWGPKAVGIRFKLSKKGKIYLKELEAAAKYEPKMRKKAIIQLKHRVSL